MLSEEEVDKMAEKVMDVLATYFWSPDDESGVLRASDWPGRKFFKKHATHWIRRNEPVKMVLPAFPFKSVSKHARSGIFLFDTTLGQPRKSLRFATRFCRIPWTIKTQPNVSRYPQSVRVWCSNYAGN